MLYEVYAAPVASCDKDWLYLETIQAESPEQANEQAQEKWEPLGDDERIVCVPVGSSVVRE